jgi:nucleoside 2-deoxyribosyltransferase
MLAFLCGVMEYAPDGGRAWRERVRAWLESTLNHRVYDPTEEARRILSEEERENFLRWKTEDFERFRRVMRFILNHDLDVMARQADYVVCWWDEAAARGGGTHAELTAAYRKGIPVYLVTEMPLGKISAWVLGCAERIFGDLEELKGFLVSTFGEARQKALWEAR